MQTRPVYDMRSSPAVQSQCKLQTSHLRDGIYLLIKQPEAITILMTPGYGGGSHSYGPPAIQAEAEAKIGLPLELWAHNRLGFLRGSAVLQPAALASPQARRHCGRCDHDAGTPLPSTRIRYSPAAWKAVFAWRSPCGDQPERSCQVCGNVCEQHFVIQLPPMMLKKPCH